MNALPPGHSTGDRGAFVDELLAWFEIIGRTRYDEAVSQSEHALQTAGLALEAGSTDEQVVAALFHDIGHLLIDEHRDRKDFLQSDGYHEWVGAQWLSALFPPAVSEPVRMHVLAKRWLCLRRDGYSDQLSQASKRSLVLQGGAMSADEAASFEDEPYWNQAVELRLWDDQAKVENQSAPDFACFRAPILGLL